MRFFVETTGGEPDDLGDLLALAPIGAGGAGTVYAPPGLAGQCVKIYKGDLAAGHEAKVRAMLANPPAQVFTDANTVQMAWPLAAVVDETGGFRGFTMPLIDFAASWGMHQVLNPRLRRAHAIPDDLILRLTAACNLAIVVESLHQVGHNIIDLKPQNIRIYDRPAGRAGFIALLDCDGFRIIDGDRVFPAALATAEYAHPAAITADATGLDLGWMAGHAREQDLWALAVLIFLMLNENHPLQGIPAGDFTDYPADLPALTRRHRDVYAYGVAANPRVAPRPGSLHRWFDPALRALFDRAFAGGLTPPAAREWTAVLRRLARRRHRCRRDRRHWKLGAECGLCALARERAAEGAQIAVPHRLSWRVVPWPNAGWVFRPRVALNPWRGRLAGWGWLRAGVEWRRLVPVALAILVVGLSGPVGLLAGWAMATAGWPASVVAFVVPLAALALVGGLVLSRTWRRRLIPAGGARAWGGRLLFAALAGLCLIGGERVGAEVGEIDGFGFAGSEVAAGAIRRYLTDLRVVPQAGVDASAGVVATPTTLPAPASASAGAVAPPTTDQVLAIQRELTRMGLYHGEIDGKVGPRTRAALAAIAGRGAVPTVPVTGGEAERLLSLLRQRPSKSR